jgi:hypothetical protein
VAVDEHGARAALPVIAAFLGAGQAELFAEQIKQRQAGVDDEAVVLAVDAEVELDLNR